MKNENIIYKHAISIVLTPRCRGSVNRDKTKGQLSELIFS